MKLNVRIATASGWLERLVRLDQVEQCTCRVARKYLKIDARGNAVSGYREQTPKVTEPGLVNHVRVLNIGESDPTLTCEETGVYQTVGIDRQSKPREPEVDEEQSNDSDSDHSRGISVAVQTHRQCDGRNETEANRENDVATQAGAI